MAHNLHIENGKASMMYVSEAPWHGLGTPLSNPATSSEAICAANLDWEVIKAPLIAYDGKASHPIPDRFAVIRKDWYGKPQPAFGIVGAAYTPLQNREAFEFFDSVVGEKAAIYHTAGALGDGERVWILAKLSGTIRVVGDDVTDKFLLLSNSHDGESSVQVKFTPIRVVCENTLTIALGRGRTVRVPHLRRIRDGLRRATELLGIVNAQYEHITDGFRRMANVALDSGSLLRYLTAVFPDPAQPTSLDERKSYERRLNEMRTNRRWSEHFFENGRGNTAVGTRRTLWAAFNGVAELTDHVVRQVTAFDETGTLKPEAALRRLDSAWFGSGAQIKIRAFRTAEKMLAGKN